MPVTQENRVTEKWPIINVVWVLILQGAALAQWKVYITDKRRINRSRVCRLIIKPLLVHIVSDQRETSLKCSWTSTWRQNRPKFRSSGSWRTSGAAADLWGYSPLLTVVRCAEYLPCMENDTYTVGLVPSLFPPYRLSLYWQFFLIRHWCCVHSVEVCCVSNVAFCLLPAGLQDMHVCGD